MSSRFSSSLPIFSGEFRHALDEKNRITIPARWRQGETDEFFLRPDRTASFLFVMPTDEFKKVAEVAAASVSPKDHRVFIRHFYSGSTHCTTDRQGRLVLPDEYCRQLKFKADVMLVGTHERFEIWNSAKWKQTQNDEAQIFARVADLVGL